MKKEAPRSVKGPPPSQRQGIKACTGSEDIADDLNGIDAGNDNEHPHDEPDRFQNPILPCTMRSEGISTEEERKKLHVERQPEVKNICTALERKLMQIARCKQHAGIGNETDQKSNHSDASRQSPNSEGSSKADKNDKNLNKRVRAQFQAR